MDVKQIAIQVYKSEPTAHDRIRKLQDKGYIQRYSAILDRMLIGRPTLMVTLVKLKEHSTATLREFAQTMTALREVQVCLQLSGEFDFLLQITLRESQEYGEFLDQHLCAFTQVDKVQSSLVLKEHKMGTALPLE